jgi:pimeloyl-ACP methyl ester carboxylesterase
VIRRALLAGGGVALSFASFRVLTRRATRRLLEAPRVAPFEAGLRSALDALGGEVVRFRSRDGLRLSARWLAAERDEPSWMADPHEAVLLLHGWSGSVSPDIVEHGPWLRRTAGVLGLDFRGHGESDDSPSTFGLREVDDVAGALAWLGERGVTRVALFGTSMGGVVAIASAVVLGDGSLPGVDAEPAAPAHVAAPPHPGIVAIVADSVPPELAVVIGSRIGGRGRRRFAERLLDGVARSLGGDPRETEPIRVAGLLEGMPLLLISGDLDATVPIADARRLAAAAPPGTDHWIVPGAGHGNAHRLDPAAYETRTTAHLRTAFLGAREAGPIIAAPARASRRRVATRSVED